MSGEQDMIRGPYRVGALLRRSFRRLLMVLDVEWEEERGLFGSLFIVTASVQEHELLHQLDPLA